MLNIKITSIHNASEYKEKWATKVITLLSDDAYLPKDFQPNKDHYVAYMDDVDEPLDFHILPSKELLKPILDFTKNFKSDDNILIHCMAGISRSTATAIAVLVQHGMDPKNAYEHIKMIRPQLWPNVLMIKLYDDLLNQDGKMLDALDHKQYYEIDRLNKWMSGREYDSIYC